MNEDLQQPASVEYGDWSGTASADAVDFSSLSQRLGIDQDEWSLVAVDVQVSDGIQTIVGYGIRSSAVEHLNTGRFDGKRLEVTKIVRTTESLHGNANTNPPEPPAGSLTWVGELIVYGFKRFHLRLLSRRVRDVGEIIPMEDITSND